MPAPTVDRIDHIHVYVADREQAAQWYTRTLGFTPDPALARWAQDPRGPLTLTDASGKVHIALFASDKPPSSTAAFGVDGKQFLAWKTHLEQEGLTLRLTDHALCWSMYFEDPDGNLHELTTYDHPQVTQALEGA